MFEDEEYDDEFYDEEYDEDGYDRDGCSRDEYVEDERPERIGFPACNLITFKEVVSDEELEYFARRRAAIPKRFFPESWVLSDNRFVSPIKEVEDAV